jgi:hypothetical protein
VTEGERTRQAIAVLPLGEIPPLRGPRPPGTARVHRRTASGLGHAAHGDRRATWGRFPARRSVLRGLTTAGTTLGLAVIGLFPPARTARAQGFRLHRGDGYDFYESCPDYATDHDCSPGCGPNLVCADCCRTTGLVGRHHTATTKSGYRLRPNVCYDDHYDGWLWRFDGKCGDCARGIVWRCHDGWKRTDSGHWFKTICRWTEECDR